MAFCLLLKKANDPELLRNPFLTELYPDCCCSCWAGLYRMFKAFDSPRSCIRLSGSISENMKGYWTTGVSFSLACLCSERNFAGASARWNIILVLARDGNSHRMDVLLPSSVLPSSS